MLLERDRQLEKLENLLEAARAGHGHTVIISGEAGIGKSTLIRAFMDEAEKNARLLWSACEDLTIAEPLAPLFDIAREVDFSLPEKIGTDGNRVAVFSEVLGVLSAGDEPTVVLVEDLHWADDATIDFLRYVSRRIATAPVLLVLTTRDDDAEGRLHARNIVGAVPPERVTRMRLMPLSMDAVEKLASGIGRDPGEIYGLTAGNPFYVTELLRTEADAYPASIQDSVLYRADRLDRTARAALDAVSVFPRRAERHLAERLAGGSEGFEECCMSGLLEDDGPYVAFRHELARRSVEAALPQSKRRALNQELLRLLREAGETAFGRLMHHAALAGDREAIVTFAPKAASEAERTGSLREATAFLALAIENGDRLHWKERAKLLDRYAYAVHQIADHNRAIGAQHEALQIYQQAGDITGEGDSYRRLSRYSWVMGRRAEARDYAERAYRTLANLRGPELAMARSTIAQLDMLDYNFAMVPEHCEAAIEIAEEFDCPEIIAHAKNNLGMALIYADPERARSLLTESLELALASHHPDDASRAYTNRAYLEMGLMNPLAALDHAKNGLAFCRAHEQHGFEQYKLGTIALILVDLGRWSEADAYLKGHADRSEVVSNRSQAFPETCALVTLAMRRGETPDPRLDDYLKRFIAEMDELQRLSSFAEIMGERAWLGQFDKDEAVLLLERVVARAGTTPETVAMSLFWLHRLGGKVPMNLSDRVAAPVRHAISGDWQRASDGWAEAGYPYLSAICLAEGDADARAEAMRILSDLGAEAARSRLMQLWSERGLEVLRPPVQKAERGHPSGLTRRQLDVLSKLNEGLSNSDIADRLFISPKTVDHHVSAILAQLGVSSRGEAAAVARDQGWV